MKKNNKVSKLRLNKSSIRNLDIEELNRVKGGLGVGMAAPNGGSPMGITGGCMDDPTFPMSGRGGGRKSCENQ